MSTDTIIEVSGLSNRFGNAMVHDKLDLQVRPGEIIGVVGGSGSGKSVLMRSILALHHPQAGRIRVLGRDALSVDAASREFIEGNTGVLFQNAALFSSLTVLENVMVPLKEHSTLPEPVMRDLAMVKIQLAGLSADAALKLPAELSGGMRKRAGIARALKPGGRLALSAFSAYYSVRYHGDAVFDADTGVSHESLSRKIDTIMERLDSMGKRSPEQTQTDILLFVSSGIFVLFMMDLLVKKGSKLRF